MPDRAETGEPVRCQIEGDRELMAELAKVKPVVYFGKKTADLVDVTDGIVTAIVPIGIEANPQISISIGSLPPLLWDQFRVKPWIVQIDPNPAELGSELTLIPDVTLEPKEEFKVWLFSQELEVLDFGSQSIVVALPDEISSQNPELTLEIGGVRGPPSFDLELVEQSSRSPADWLALAFGAAGVLVILISAGRKLFGKKETTLSALPTPSSLQPRSTAEPQVRYDGPPIPEVPEQLARDIASGDCVLFAGGGLSVAAGFPTWDGALGRLLERASTAAVRSPDGTVQQGKGLPPSLLDELRDASLFEALDLLKASFGADFVHSFVEETYGGDVRKLPKLPATVSTLPFAGVITTNWDDVVTKGFRSRGRPRLPTEWEELNTVFREDEFFLIKLHGNAKDRSSLVLTPKDYNRLLELNNPFKRFMMSLYASKTFLFLGSSRKSIEQFLAALTNEETQQNHYAVVPYERGFGRHHKVFKENYKVELLGYQPTSEHLEVIEFVDNLKKRVAESREAMPEATDEPAPWLQKLALENIGPFEELHLDFEQDWNVLLGDNGCGKSTILRAIALGLCGPDERVGPLAGNLLRHGKSPGSVSLTIAGDTYTTRLIRESGRVRVESPQRYTPLEQGTWLALGFPALRGFSNQDPTEPIIEIESRPPAADDLIPLLGGEIDTRMNDFKQWIYNAYIRSSSDDGEELAQIFSFLESLTPGLRLSFAEIDKTTMKIMVKTNDGQVPLELLSQGTSSMIAVAGTLMQRLRAVYNDRPEQAKQPALVIVDELAAHMHPSWQYSLAGLLQQNFENLQIVVATHSPLVLGSIEKGTIFRVKRTKEEGIKVEATSKPLYGWLAEDIYDFMGLEDTRAEGFRVDLNTFKQLDEMRLKGTASEGQLEKLEQLRERMDDLPGDDPVSLTMELDNLADMIDEAKPPAAADPGDTS